MSTDIAVRVDLTNPGQYFACCGLLELTHRMQPEAQGWFDAGLFHIRGGVGSNELMDALHGCKIVNTMTSVQKQRREELAGMGQKTLKADAALDEERKELDGMWRESPVVFGGPFHFRVDWFLDDRSGGKSFKTWAGQQSIIDIVNELRKLLQEPEGDDWFRATPPSDSVPLNFDSNLGGAGSDIDVGFSFDPLKSLGLRVGIRPMIELLAFVGLQRFRPAVAEGAWDYGVWKTPAVVDLACLACCGVTPRLVAGRYRFHLLYRTKYLKSFLPGRLV